METMWANIVIHKYRATRYNRIENAPDLLKTIEFPTYIHHIQFTIMRDIICSLLIYNHKGHLVYVPGHIISKYMSQHSYATVCDVMQEYTLV